VIIAGTPSLAVCMVAGIVMPEGWHKDFPKTSPMASIPLSTLTGYMNLMN